MAQEKDELEKCRARNLELLQSGDFSDVDIICGERSWKCHRAILITRSDWFLKALSGPFLEARTQQVVLEEQDPKSVDLAFKYIYGFGLDVGSSVSDDHFLEECVSLWHTADFFLLKSLRSSAEKAVYGYCDKQMKQLFTLCTYGNRITFTWSILGNEFMAEMSPWVSDFLIGLRLTYKWSIEYLKKVLMEFLWSARGMTLKEDGLKATLEILKDTPTFVTDLLSHYATGEWYKSAAWAPNTITTTDSEKCARCGIELQWAKPEQSMGRMLDPFCLEAGIWTIPGMAIRVWCQECVKLDMIPWREQAPDSEG